MNFLLFASSKRKVSTAHSIWRCRFGSSQRIWYQKSSKRGRRQLISVEDFLAGNLLPWWIQCVKCNCWRQVVAHHPIGCPESPYHPSRFTCDLISQGSNDSCSWPVDDRSVLVRNRPHDFLASMKIHSWLQGSPTSSILAPYGVDLCGLSADALPGATDNTKSDKSLNDPQSVHRIIDEHGPFSIVDLRAWERIVFPEMTRFPTLYLAVRNLILYLWLDDPKRFLTARFVANHCFVRGLLRIVLCDHWIPHIIEEFTCRGLINVGSCVLESTNDIAPSDASEGESRLRVHVVGELNLSGTVATRQILNSLLARVKPSSRQPCIKPASPIDTTYVRFHPISNTRICYSAADAPDALAELGIKLIRNNAQVGPLVTDNDGVQSRDDFESHAHHFSDEWHPVTVSDCNMDPSLSTLDQLVVPIHMWSDRVYCHPNHPIRFLTAQADVSLRPMNKCLLLHNAASEATTGPLQTVSDEVSLRMEFHVEAVLDAVSQYHQMPVGDADFSEDKPKWLSVQECWDLQDAQVRTRLTDLSRSTLEHQLIEFFLAEVECDLTEPLVTNNPYHFLGYRGSTRLRSWACPTARLDRLPSFRYMEFTTDNNPGLENSDLGSNGCAHLITCREPSKSHISVLCQSLLQDTFSQSRVVRVTVKRDQMCILDSSDFGEELNRSTCLSSTARTDHGNLFVESTETETNTFDSVNDPIIVSTAEGGREFADWLVLICPIERIRVNFYDVSSPDSHHTVSECMVLDLPTSLKSYIVCDESEPDTIEVEKIVDSDFESIAESRARLITVTLVYITPWWRAGLQDLLTPISMKINSSKAEASPEWFAILPQDRENRGFCHTFRDLFPQIDQPGVLQTQLFGAAADHWWSKDDTLLTANVHQYIQNRWVFNATDSNNDMNDSVVPIIPNPVYPYVARMQYTSNGHSVCKDQSLFHSMLRLIDTHGKVLRLRPDAWEVMARRTHILIPSLFPPSIMSASDLAEDDGRHGLTENELLPRSPGMDVLTSTVLDGLHIANQVVRCIPGLGSGSILSYPSFHSKLDSTLVDSSTLPSECSQTDESHSNANENSQFESGALSARAMRLLRRTHRNSESNTPSETV